MEVTGTGEKSGMALIPAGDFVKTDHPDGSYWVANYISAFYIDRAHVTKPVLKSAIANLQSTVLRWNLRIGVAMV